MLNELGLVPPFDPQEAEAKRRQVHAAMIKIENAPPWLMSEILEELRRLERIADYMDRNVKANK